MKTISFQKAQHRYDDATPDYSEQEPCSDDCECSTCHRAHVEALYSHVDDAEERSEWVYQHILAEEAEERSCAKARRSLRQVRGAP